MGWSVFYPKFSIFASTYVDCYLIMGKIKIVKGEFAKQLSLQIAPAIKAGFPSPAEDYLQDRIDFNRDLIKHPEATFYGRVSGDSMVGVGIYDGDIAVIDRAEEPKDKDIVVAYVNGEFTLKFLNTAHAQEGYIELMPANENFKPIKVVNDDDFEIWGVVTFVIKNCKNLNVLRDL